MQEISDLILKAKALKQRKEYSQAITLLNRAHELGVENNAVQELVDIHNQLILLHYQNNDTTSFTKLRMCGNVLNKSLGDSSQVVIICK